jgi:Ca2+/Na+ antiporter
MEGLIGIIVIGVIGLLSFFPLLRSKENREERKRASVVLVLFATRIVILLFCYRLNLQHLSYVGKVMFLILHIAASVLFIIALYNFHKLWLEW